MKSILMVSGKPVSTSVGQSLMPLKMSWYIVNYVSTYNALKLFLWSFFVPTKEIMAQFFRALTHAIVAYTAIYYKPFNSFVNCATFQYLYCSNKLYFKSIQKCILNMRILDSDGLIMMTHFKKIWRRRAMLWQAWIDSSGVVPRPSSNSFCTF